MKHDASVLCIWMKSIFSSTIHDTKGFKPVTIFRFSKDKVRIEEWINKIPTPNSKVSGKTRVCIQHLDDKYIKRSDIFKSRNSDPYIIVSIDKM